jgi:protein-disulfide isomerase
MRVALIAVAAALAASAAGPAEVDKGKILGSPGAPVKIEVYSDFACPACRSFHEQTLPMIVNDYVMKGKVAIVNHEFPLNIPAHKYSKEAANYATAAARLGIYQPVADALFRTQESWNATGKVWETVASVLNAEQQKKVQALAKEPSVAAEVQRDVDAGMREKVSSTPSIFVVRGAQRLPIPFPVNYSFLRSLLDGYLK